MCRINLSNSSTAEVREMTDAVQKEVEAFRTIVLDGALPDEQDIDNLLSMYESFHILNVLPEQRASFQMQQHYVFPASFVPACSIGRDGSGREHQDAYSV